MAAHVFIDNSNIFYGAQRAAATIESGAVWLAVRLYYRNLFTLIEGGRTVQSRVFAGSVPPGNDFLWEHARRAGYNTDLLRKVERDDGNLREQGVDELLHLKMANAILDHTPPQVLVVATGDGGDSDYATSFTAQVRRALEHGWDVEVWSWKDQLSGRFDALRGTGTGTITTHLLDPHYMKITFLQEGEYEIRGSWVRLAGRVVGRL